MKKAALIYSLIMLSTLVYMPFQFPVPKIGGQWDAGYHLTVQKDKKTGALHVGRPRLQAQDLSILRKALNYYNLGYLLRAEAPLKYSINYPRLFSEWFFVTFIFLIWMLAARFSRPNQSH